MTSTDLVPAANMAALEAMEPATREVAVTHMLSEARQWLAHAMETTGPQAIADFKAFVATVEESTRQLGLSREIQLDATEMVRRAERGLGQAVRKGQSEGTINSRESALRMAPNHGHPVEPTMTSPDEFFGANRTRVESYAMADGVSDAEFEDAIGEAKAEGNLARANVIRKIRGESPTSSRPDVLRKTRRLDSNRIVEQTVLTVAGIDSLFGQIDFSELDRALMPGWLESLAESIKALRALRTNIDRELTR